MKHLFNRSIFLTAALSLLLGCADLDEKPVGLLAPESRIGTETFWTTGSPEQVAAVVEQLWSSKVDVWPMPVASKERSASTR